MMIACKEDLINTYIDNTNSELFSVWFELVKGIVEKDEVSVHWLKQNKYCSVESGKSGELFVNSIDGIWLKGKRELTLSDLKPTKQYAVLHKGGGYSFQSDMPIGNDVVACFDLANSEKPLSEDFFDEKPRTKVEFVKVDDSIWHLESSFRLGELFAFDGDSNYVQVETEGDFTLSHSSDNLYRRIETSMTEREAMYHALNEITDCGKNFMSVSELFDLVADSGKFKLVN